MISVEYLTGQDILPEKEFLEKVGTMKRFEYSPLGKELTAQTDIAKNQYKNYTILWSLIKQLKKENQHLQNIIDQI